MFGSEAQPGLGEEPEEACEFPTAGVPLSVVSFVSLKPQTLSRDASMMLLRYGSTFSYVAGEFRRSNMTVMILFELRISFGSMACAVPPRYSGLAAWQV